PTCEKPLIRRKSKNGFFWGCSGYPNCTITFNDKRGKPDFNKTKSKTKGK
ncbi:topoisomerase DNA-binding C4 zinc finger domain-containing protein, partial [Escherichia coli]